MALQSHSQIESSKILIFGDVDYETFPTGGVLSLLCDYLTFYPRELADRTYLIGLTTEKNQSGRIIHRRFGGMRFRFLPIGYIPPGYRGSIRLKFLCSIVAAYPVLRALSSRVIYAHSNESAFLLKLLFPHRRVVVHFHGLRNPIWGGKFRSLRHSPLVKLYDLLCYDLLVKLVDTVAVNIDEKAFTELKARYQNNEKKFIRIPPLVNTKLFHFRGKNEVRKAIGMTHTDKILVFHGRLTDMKGVDLVLEAMAIVQKRVPQCTLYVIGDGPEKERLQEYSLSLGLRDKAIFLSSLPREKVALYLSAADAFVTGTRFEAISVALLEAIAVGLPAVTTLVNGAEEIIRNGINGYILDTRDPSEMATRIIECVGARADTMSQNALDSAKTFFPEKIIPKLMEALFGRAGDQSFSLGSPSSGTQS
jgi:glycosyltransferase involved in cell wall biosynthesis